MSTGSRPAVPALSWKGAYDRSERTLFVHHSSGFFSNCCVTLWNLREIQLAGEPLPLRIDYSGSFEFFRNAEQQAQRTDLYPLFFRPAVERAVPAVRLPFVEHHGQYAFLDYRRINPVIQRYFKPSAHALDIQARLKLRYRIDPARTLAVVYRGTDKKVELLQATPEAYLRLARRLLMQNPGYRLWIQTDERAVRDLFCEAFGERCFYLREMPVSSDGRVVHEQDDQALSMPRSEFGVQLVAVTHLLAQCDLVINHTGNMALWLCLFRGHGRGVWQFDDEGRAVNPQRPGAWFGAARRFWIKAVRRVRLLLSGRGASRPAS
jgi:hypothetical protein